MRKSKGSCKRAPLSACAGKAEEGAVAEPRRLTTTPSSVRDEWGAACSPRTWPSKGASAAGATHRPRAVAAGGVTDPFGHGDLLLTAVLVGATRTAVRLPGAEVELETAVVAVAGVRGPVAAGLAGGDPVP